MAQGISRRRFLAASGALSLTLLRPRWGLGASPARGAQDAKAAGAKRAVPDYRSWEDVYRRKWTWDKVIRGAHHVVNCAEACPFNVFVKDGIVWREEQNAAMRATGPGLPDHNPRGCQKGVCFSQLMYAPSRVLHPLKRAGARGEGKWKRISWDEALTEIADTIIDVCLEDGPECVVYDSGTANADYGAPTSGEMHFFDVIGATQLDGWACVGDMPLGLILTLGLFNIDGTGDDYFHSDLILIWLGNPSYTHIPTAHFLWEARYHGSRIVSIAPDYSPSTMHCDQWVNVRVGTDAALGLGMAHVIVEEGLYKKRFVQEQTDLPLLVREDTGRFLREADLVVGGRENVFYLWDSQSERLSIAPGSEGLGRGTRLELGKLEPALEGRFEARLADGRRVAVRPVFELLRKRLASFAPEAVERITGVGADTVRQLARDVAKARTVSIFGSWGMMKHYHSDLFQRTMALLLALTGNIGYRGTGFHVGAWYMLSALETIMAEAPPSFFQKLLMKVFKPTVRELIAGIRDYEREHMYMNVPALAFLYQHGGLKQVVDNPSYHSRNPGKPLAEAMREAIEKGWIPLYPRPGKRPRVYVHTRVNPLRRWPSPHVVEKNLWPKLDLIVSVNLRLSTTALKSDIVLPACGYYERRGIKYAQSYLPYYVVGEKAVEPLGESKTEWEIFGLLAKRIQERAQQRGVKPVPDARGRPRDLRQAYERWSMGRRFSPEDDKPFYEIAMRESPETGGISWERAAKQGVVRIQGLGPFRTHTNICSDFEPGKSVYPCQWFVQQKQPWPTLTGRMQFYIDHEWFLAAGEELPTHKESPKAGGDYPLRLVGGHNRWSIHSIWRDEPHLLRLHRGEPVVYVSQEDARERGIRDNDRVRIFNDVGSCELLAKVSPALQPGEAIVYHAWEPFQYKRWESYQNLVASPWKALHMVEYGQLHYRFLYGGPHHTPRAQCVEIERV